MNYPFEIKEDVALEGFAKKPVMKIGRKIFKVALRLCGLNDDFPMTMYYDLGWAQNELANLDLVRTRRVGADWEWYLV